MANVKLLFYGTEISGTEEIGLECFHNQHNEVTIKLDVDQHFGLRLISMDKETAVKFSRELRKQIALID